MGRLNGMSGKGKQERESEGECVEEDSREKQWIGCEGGVVNAVRGNKKDQKKKW